MKVSPRPPASGGGFRSEGDTMFALERVTLILLVSSLIVACGLSPLATATGQYTAQLIIKFSEPTIDPMRADFVEHLSRDAGVTLVYVRPMSGGAHLFRIEHLSDKEQLAGAIKRLTKRTDILYVEPDRVLRHQ